jgi:hypothetical protein
LTTADGRSGPSGARLGDGRNERRDSVRASVLPHDHHNRMPQPVCTTARPRTSRRTLSGSPVARSRMESDQHYPEEAPVHRIRVAGFWIDRTPVTNRQFREFMKATATSPSPRSRRTRRTTCLPATHAAARLARLQLPEGARGLRYWQMLAAATALRSASTRAAKPSSGTSKPARAGRGAKKKLGNNAMQSEVPLHQSPRCGARTRSGGSGRAKSVTDLAEQERVMVAYVCRRLPLTCLAPEIVEAILDGRQPKGSGLRRCWGPGPWRGRSSGASGALAARQRLRARLGVSAK